MDNSEIRFRRLFKQYMTGQMTREEITELQNFAQNRQYTATLEEILFDAYSDPSLARETPWDDDEFMKALLAKNAQREEQDSLRLGRTRRMVWMAAATITFIAIGFWFYVLNRNTRESIAWTKNANSIKSPDHQLASIENMKPSPFKIDSAFIGMGVVVSLFAQTLYDADQKTIIYNDTIRNIPAEYYIMKSHWLINLKNPKGSKVIDTTLEDGTRVWLNAGSSLIFPTNFTNNIRTVSLRGEGYFEVAYDAARPFKIFLPARNASVQIERGALNVTNYMEEKLAGVTMLDGAAVLTQQVTQKKFAIPTGQKATVLQRGNIVLGKAPSSSDVLAWKNGLFDFHDNNTEAELGQMARWYNMEFVNQSDTPVKAKFNGTISRQLDAGEVLRKIQLSGPHNFKVDGRKVIMTK